MNRPKARTTKLVRQLHLLLDAPGRFLFGRDFFISYSRRDAAAYAATLANKLAEQHSCYLDQLAIPRGAELPVPIRREVKRAATVVLVGSRAAVDSSYVKDEIELFLETGRPLLLIDVDGALQHVPWDVRPWVEMAGVSRHHESPESFARGDPSAGALKYLRDSFTFTSQSRRLRLASVSAALLLAVVLAVATVVSLLTTRAATNAVQRADSAARREAEAVQRAGAAEGKEQDAVKSAAVAQQAAVRAGALADEARALEAAARASADEQRRLAASRRLANESSTEIRGRPDLGLLLAAQAHRTFPTVEAHRSLLSGLIRYPGLVRVVRDAQTTSAGTMSASGDRRVLATGDNDVVTIWDATTLQPRRRITEARENFGGLALSPDASVVAIARSQHVTLVDVLTGREIGRIAKVSTGTLSFLDRSQLIVGEGKSVRIWDVSSPARPVSTAVLPVDESVKAVAVHQPSGRLIVATFKQLFVCELSSCSTDRHSLTGKNDVGFEALAVSTSAAEPRVAAVNVAGHVAVWDLNTRERLVNLSLPGRLADSDALVPGDAKGMDIFTLAISPDGERLAVGSLRGRLTIASVERMSEVSALLQHEDGSVRDAEIAFAGAGLVNLPQIAYTPGVIALAFGGAQNHLLLSDSEGRISVWDTSRQQSLTEVTELPEEPVDAHAFSGDGRFIAFDADEAVYAWEIERPDSLVKLDQAFDESVMKLAFAPDGSVIAGMESASSAEPYRTLALWARSGRLLWRQRIDERVAPKVEGRTFPKELVIAGPPQSRHLGLGLGDGTVLVWNISQPSRPRLLGGRRFRLDAMSLSPVGAEIGVVDYEGIVSLWDVARNQVHTLPGKVPGTEAIAFSRDGRTLTAFAREEDVSVVASWDVSTRAQRFLWRIYEKGDRWQ